MVLPALVALIEGEDPIVASAAAVAAGICGRGTEHTGAAAAITARRQRAQDLAERWATAIGLAQLLNSPGPTVPADVRAATEAPAPVPRFPFLGGAIDALAMYTLDRLDNRHTIPSGPWSG